MRLLIALFVLVSSTAFAQDPTLPIDEKTGKITYVEVVEEGGTQAELFERSKAWFNSFYKNPKQVIQSSDAEAGKIEGKHRFEIERVTWDKKGKEASRTSAGYIFYHISLGAKDGKYRYQVTDIQLFKTTKKPVEPWIGDGNATNQDMLRQIDAYMKDLVASIKKGMKPADAGGSDDW